MLKSTKTGFLRLTQVLELIPVSKSSWWAGVKAEKYPKPFKLGAKMVAWRVEDINELIQSIGQRKEGSSNEAK